MGGHTGHGAAIDHLEIVEADIDHSVADRAHCRRSSGAVQHDLRHYAWCLLKGLGEGQTEEQNWNTGISTIK